MTDLTTDPQGIELGLDTFGDVTRDASGALLSHAQTIRNTVEQAVLADTVGLSFFGVGEHHRPEFAVSSPEIVLAAAAARTERIHLGTSRATIPCACSSGSRPSTRSRTGEPR